MEIKEFYSQYKKIRENSLHCDFVMNTLISRNFCKKKHWVKIPQFTRSTVFLLSNAWFFVKLKSILILFLFCIICQFCVHVIFDFMLIQSLHFLTSSNKIFRFWLQQPKAVSSNKLSGKIKTLAKKNQLTISSLLFFLFETWEFASLHSSWLLYVLLCQVLGERNIVVYFYSIVPITFMFGAFFVVWVL